MVISFVSFLRLLENEYVFFNPKHLKDAVADWKTLDKHNELTEWIKKYEGQLRMKGEISEIGERFVDLSSSPFHPPCYLSIALEYECEPDYGEIVLDLRKSLNVLARVKVGIFHSPTVQSISRPWAQKAETGEIKMERRVLGWEELRDRLLKEMQEEIKLNELEHPYTIHLIIFIHAQAKQDKVNLYGYLFWRDTSGKVSSEVLEPKSVRLLSSKNRSLETWRRSHKITA